MKPLPRTTIEEIDRTVERLMQGVRVVEELPQDGKHRFDLANYINECGTVGCFVGWSGLDPWFRRRGLRTSKEDENV